MSPLSSQFFWVHIRKRKQLRSNSNILFTEPDFHDTGEHEHGGFFLYAAPRIWKSFRCLFKNTHTQPNPTHINQLNQTKPNQTKPNQTKPNQTKQTNKSVESFSDIRAISLIDTFHITYS